MEKICAITFGMLINPFFVKETLILSALIITFFSLASSRTNMRLNHEESRSSNVFGHFLMNAFLSMSDQERSQAQQLSGKQPATSLQEVSEAFSIISKLDYSSVRKYSLQFNRLSSQAMIKALTSVCDLDVLFHSYQCELNQSVEHFMFDGILPSIIFDAQGSTNQRTRFSALNNASTWINQCLTLIRKLKKQKQVAEKEKEETKDLEFEQQKLLLIQSQQKKIETIGEHFVACVPEIFEKIIFTNWENPISSIVYECRRVLVDVLSIHDCLPSHLKTKFNLNELLVQILDADPNRKSKYMALELLLPRVGACNILEKQPNFVNLTLNTMNNASLRGIAGNLLEKMSSKLYKEKQQMITSEREKEKEDEKEDQAKQQWRRIIVDPAIRLMLISSPVLQKGIAIYVLPHVLTFVSDNLEYILESLRSEYFSLIKEFAARKQETEHAYSKAESNLMNDKDVDSHLDRGGVELALSYQRSFIFVLKHARSSNLFKGSLESIGPVMSNLVVLETAMTVEDDNIRLDCLELVCINPQTTYLLSNFELKLVKKFLVLNMKTNSAAFRSRLRIVMKKLLQRMRDGLYKYKKQRSSDAESFQANIQFLKWLSSFLKGSLYPTSPYDRRLLSLFMVQTVIYVFDNTEKSVVSLWPASSAENGLEPLSFYTAELTQLLLNSLTETWYVVRDMAYDVIMRLPQPFPGYEDATDLVGLIQWGKDMVSSPLLHDADTGAHFLRSLFGKYVLKGKYEKNFKGWEIKFAGNNCDVTPSKSSDNFNVIKFLNELFDFLELKYNECTENISNIKDKSSMHGTILTIRYVLSMINFNDIKVFQGVQQEWKSFFKRIVELLHKIAHFTLFFLTDSAIDLDEESDTDLVVPKLPEGASGIDCRGHIFFKADELAQPENEEQSSNGETKMSEQSARVLVVSMWLTMKETALLFGSIVESVPFFKSPQHSNHLSEDSFLSVEQIEQIGNLFLHILTSTKHNGVINKSYLAFMSINKKLLSCSVPQLCLIPAKWLQTVLAKIHDDSTVFLRRSAGLPFMFLALLKSEPVGMPPTLLAKAMDALFATAKDTSSSWEPRVHSLNVLRHLINDAFLSSNVMPYVPDGLIIALDGFTDPVWAVRNSSMMLYSALITRSVGTKRSSDDTSSVNKVTGRSFFTRCPGLRETLLKYLKLATTGKNRSSGTLHPSLFPVLLLLSNLTPSFHEEVNDPAGMEEFVPYVKVCASLRNYLGRSVSSRALVALIPSVKVKSFLRELFEELRQCKHSNANKTHGLLLHIFQLIQLNLKQTIIDMKDHNVLLDIVQCVSDNVDICYTSNRCHIHKHAFFCIVDEIINQCEQFKIDHDNLVQSLLSQIHPLALKAVQVDIPKTDFCDVGFGLMRSTGSTLHLRALLLLVSYSHGDAPRSCSHTLAASLQRFLQHHDREVIIATCQFISKHHATLLALGRGLESNDSKNTSNDPVLLNVDVRAMLFSLILDSSDPLVLQHGINTIHRIYYRHPQLSIANDLRALAPRDHFRPEGDNVAILETLWNHLKNCLLQDSNEYIQESVVETMGTIIKQMEIEITTLEFSEENHSSKIWNHLVEEWTQFIEKLKDPKQIPELRKAAINSIECSEVLLSNNSSSNNNSREQNALRLWFVIIVLLQDEDPSIRTVTAQFVSSCLDSNGEKRGSDIIHSHVYTPLQFVKTVETVFQHVTRYYAATCPELPDMLVRLIALPSSENGDVDLRMLDGKPTTKDNNDNNTDKREEIKGTPISQLFQKDDENAFEEILLMLQLCCSHLGKALSRSSSAFNQQQLGTQYANLFASQLEQLINSDKVQNGTWIGSITNHPNVFLALYRPLIGIASLPHREYLQGNQKVQSAVQKLLQLGGHSGFNRRIQELAQICMDATQSTSNAKLDNTTEQQINSNIFFLTNV